MILWSSEHAAKMTSFCATTLNRNNRTDKGWQGFGGRWAPEAESNCRKACVFDVPWRRGVRGGIPKFWANSHCHYIDFVNFWTKAPDVADQKSNKSVFTSVLEASPRPHSVVCAVARFKKWSHEWDVLGWKQKQQHKWVTISTQQSTAHGMWRWTGCFENNPVGYVRRVQPCQYKGGKGVEDLVASLSDRD
jgi:hypothetical protein